MSKRLLKSGMIVSAMTFISRVLGLVRDVVVANLMGAGASADVFFFANKIPNFLRRLFAEGAFSQAFVPVLTESHAQGDMNKTRGAHCSCGGYIRGDSLNCYHLRCSRFRSGDCTVWFWLVPRLDAWWSRG